MSHQLNLKELAEQDFIIKVLIGSSTEDKKKLELVATHADEYKSYFLVTHKKQPAIFEHFNSALEYYNSI